MNTTTEQTLETRLLRLERQNRILLTCLGCVVGVGAFTAAKHPVVENAGVLKATRFSLVDDRGYEVGSLSSDKGTTSLKLGRSVLLAASEDDDGGALRFIGKNSVVLSSTRTDGAALSLVQNTNAGQGRINMATNGTGPEFHLVGSDKAVFDLDSRNPTLSVGRQGGVNLFNLGSSGLDYYGQIRLRRVGGIIQTLPSRDQAAGGKVTKRWK